MVKKAIITTILFHIYLAGSAFSHDSGHGPKLEGLGPKGGKLSGVILAEDADLGKKAPLQMIAEWKIKNELFEVSFYEKDQKTLSKLPISYEVKWILLGSFDKPVVQSDQASGAQLKLKLSKENFSKVKKIEGILSFKNPSKKYVFLVENLH